MTWLRRLLHRHVQDHLTRVQDEQRDIVQQGRDREPMLRRLEGRNEDNHFAEGFRIALGGDP